MSQQSRATGGGRGDAFMQPHGNAMVPAATAAGPAAMAMVPAGPAMIQPFPAINAPVPTRGPMPPTLAPMYPVPRPSSSASFATEEGISTRSTSAWTDAEDRLLEDARTAGKNWQQIARDHFNSSRNRKTPNACRKRHERLKSRHGATAMDGPGPELDELALGYIELREQLWQPLAERLDLKWHVVEEKVRTSPW
ncbi:MAG: hypothetical protein INR71_03840 [Terriglobus roseus]|nr:hypothetical protein [Terriglobus roseus]